MTAKDAKDWVRKAAEVAAILVPATAGALAVAKAVGATKLDTVRFERDSLARDYREFARDARQAARDSVLSEIDRRTREMYCAGKPPGCR